MGVTNDDYAQLRKNFAIGKIWQFTLRRLQDIFINPKFWIGFGAVIMLLAVIGPFGTNASMDFPNRLVYWAVISAATFFVASIISTFSGNLLFATGLPEWVAWIVAGLLCGLPVAGLVWVLNHHLFDINISNQFSFLQFVGYSSLISLAIVILVYLVTPRDKPPQNSDNSNTSSPFLSRLPKNLGKTLVSIEAQDHYINVKTTKGSEMILMRLGDAQKELETYPGLRIHRSWWVASDAIVEVMRASGKIELKLSDDSVVPVSRANVKAVGEMTSI